jgi:unsaturated rhamnogalacturonyl hydrolase
MLKQKQYSENKMIIKITRTRLTLAVFAGMSICFHAAAQQTMGERMAAMVIKMYPDSLVVKKYVTHERGGEKITEEVKAPAVWDYEQGVLLAGFEILYKQTNNAAYFNYIKKIEDRFVKADGSIRTYDLTDYNIDDVAPGRLLLLLYQETKDEKYKIAAYHIREQLQWQPRTKEGGFWHKHRYPYQMWLDGLYMGEPFYARFASMFNEKKDFDDIANQFIWMENHSRNNTNGLLYHGWDESKQQRWANPTTGQSPEFWARAIGWYAMALVDALDYFPKDHPKQKELILILQRLAKAIESTQDATSGVWYQVIDKRGSAGNYLEASASCMFTYALAKGVRLGYLDKHYTTIAQKAYAGILKNFIETDLDGTVHLTHTCSGAGLGGTPYRDGSYEYYIKESTRKDDLKGIGPFIGASVEIEQQLKQAH